MLPLSDEQLTGIISRLDIPSLTEATIRQVVAVTTEAEKASGEKYMHLELGNPGLPSQQIGVEAECEALRNGIANKYPPVMGTTALKNAASRFVKAFLDVDIPGNCIVPSVGSMQGSFSLMLLLGRRDPAKDTMLYLDPGFAPQHLQAQILGLKQTSFDIYDYRGEALAEKLESILAKGNITGILYSNPNNPAWTNLTPDELASIGRLATKYDAIVIEDLAYMGMDFRHDCGTPFEEPYVPTIAKYTDNYVLLLSASKIFSYAGRRTHSPGVHEPRSGPTHRPGADAGIQDAHLCRRLYIRRGILRVVGRDALGAVRHGRHARGRGRRTHKLRA